MIGIQDRDIRAIGHNRVKRTVEMLDFSHDNRVDVTVDERAQGRTNHAFVAHEQHANRLPVEIMQCQRLSHTPDTDDSRRTPRWRFNGNYKRPKEFLGKKSQRLWSLALVHPPL